MEIIKNLLVGIIVVLGCLLLIGLGIYTFGYLIFEHPFIFLGIIIGLPLLAWLENIGSFIRDM